MTGNTELMAENAAAIEQSEAVDCTILGLYENLANQVDIGKIKWSTKIQYVVLTDSLPDSLPSMVTCKLNAPMAQILIKVLINMFGNRKQRRGR